MINKRTHGETRTGLILAIVIPAYSPSFSVHVHGATALDDAARIADATRAPVYLYDVETGIEWSWRPSSRVAA